MRFEFTAGDSLLLGKGDTTDLLVDGKRSDAPVPAELMAAGERHRERFQAEATRLEGDLWEVLVSAL